MSESAIPQWKKDLIARLRSQNKRTAHAQQLFTTSERTLVPSSAVQQPVECSREKCECAAMVQERFWADKSDSDEDLHYGPGIVSKLKERYLSLAQREKPRPSILRKAASLENILDDAPVEPNRLFQASQNKNVPNRYTKRGPELKRARSVETISTADERETKERKRESLHEEMLIANRGSLIIPEKPPDNGENKFARISRPKRIAPVMNEKEKPPADVVKQTKMIFERRPEQRTKAPQQTGEVAAKVANFKSIIVQNKPLKKPAVKAKPVVADNKPKTNGIKVRNNHIKGEERPRTPEKKLFVDVPRPQSPQKVTESKDVPPLKNSKAADGPKSPKAEDVPKIPKLEDTLSPKTPNLKLSSDVPSPKKSTPLPSPIPDISRVDFKADESGAKSTSLTETPDLIITSSPLAAVNSPTFKKSATENFIKEEIRLAETARLPSPPPKESKKPPTPQPNQSMTFNFATANTTKAPNHLPVNKNVLNTQTPPSQPLKVEVNGVAEAPPSPKKKLPPPSSSNDKNPSLLSAKPPLTTLEIQKNFINAAKSSEQPSKNSVITKSVKEVTNVPKKVNQKPREAESNSLYFNFLGRKDVPDYVHNDGVKRAAKLEKPKVGEGGIIVLDDAFVGESFTDEDEEILRSLEGPPSPCDVTFINDNILIDGKSSLSQKTKKSKAKISFVNEDPEIYEYPSESSLLVDDSPTSPPVAQIRHSVPSLSGTSSLANYTPKGTEDFQPGVSRRVQNQPQNKPENAETNDLILHEVEKPIMFSAGANSDILF